MNVYIQFAAHSLKPTPFSVNDTMFVVLLPNTGWNDFSYFTTFDAHFVVSGRWEHLGELKIAVTGEINTHDQIVLAREVSNGTYFFEIQKPYLSLPQNTRFYRRLREKLEQAELEELLNLIGDVAFLEQRHPSAQSLGIRKEEVFRLSLLRNPSAVTAYGDAKEIIFPSELIPTRFDFDAEVDLEPDNHTFTVGFKFSQRQDGLPTNICVVIGRNGLGKTQVLLQVQRGLCGPVANFQSPDTHKAPAFREIIAISFSPFEKFPHEPKEAANGRPAYRYCGFRNKEGKWDYEAAERSVGENLTELVRDHLTSTDGKRPRLLLLVAALSAGLEKSRLAVTRGGVTILIPDFLKLPGLLESLASVPIQSGEVVFDGVPFAKMSAGQKMFLLAGTAVCSHVESESLFLIDEPELYLHPSLETEYFKMLHDLLKLFASYAIIATHSVFVAREVPEEKVIVLRRGSNAETIATEPEIPTFGGDIDSIVNYVFDDLGSPKLKAYEETLDEIANERISYDEIVTKYEQALGPESLAYIRQRKNQRRGEHGNI